MIGSETALLDLPQLTVRSPGAALEKQPLRVVLDRRGRVITGPLIENCSQAATLIFTSTLSPESSRQIWKDSGVDFFVLPTTSQSEDVDTEDNSNLREVLRILGDRGILQILVEGGPTIQSAFIKEGLVDQLAIYVGGCLLGSSGLGWAKASLTSTMSDVSGRWAIQSIEQVGNDVFMMFAPKLEKTDNSFSNRLEPELIAKQHSPNLSSSERVQAAIDAIREGKMILIIDDKDRENEGDLMIAARNITADQVGFMIHHTSGILCAPMPKAHADRLSLPLMYAQNQDPRRTAFTISCDSVATGTGVSASDRARTFRALASDQTLPEDLTRPGHIFPLISNPGGVHARSGHTEAAVALCKLADIFPPVAVIGEVTCPDGTMATGSTLEHFAKQHGNMPVITLEDLRQFIPNPHHAFPIGSEARIPILRDGLDLGEWRTQVYRIPAFPTLRTDSRPFGDIVVMIKGNLNSTSPLCRVHSECFTGDTLGSVRCDCRAQLTAAMAIIHSEGHGIILYVLYHEGRGIGLPSKLAAYALMDRSNCSLDTYAANKALGHAEDERSYEGVVSVLNTLGLTCIRLLTNNPDKIAALSASGLVIQRVPLVLSPLPTPAALYVAQKVESKAHFPMVDLGMHIKCMPGARMPAGPTCLEASQYHFTIIRTSWNHSIVDSLENAVLAQLGKRGVVHIRSICVPGAFELPLTAQRAAQDRAFSTHAIIALGVLIKGDTAHFEYISSAVSQGLMNVQLQTNIPIVYGVLNLLSESQALERIDPAAGLGASWADTALSFF